MKRPKRHGGRGSSNRLASRALMIAVLAVFIGSGCAQSSPARGRESAPVSGASGSATASAFRRLASGSPREAATEFRAVLASGADPHYAAYNDALRGVFLADLYAKNDRAANADLTAAIAQAGGVPSGDRAAARGRWNEAWRGYLRDAESAGAPCTDATVAQGIRFALAGRLAEARAAWAEADRYVGNCAIPIDPYLLPNGDDTKSALTGLSFVQQRDWQDAQAALITGVRMQRATSGYTKLFPGNIVAMHLLFAYRAHFARGEAKYRWRE